MNLVIERAIDVLAAQERPSKHSQRCPVWELKRPIRECVCWIARDAQLRVEALAAAGLLASEVTP